MRSFLTLLIVLLRFTCDLESSLHDPFNDLCSCLLHKVLAVVFTDLFKEQHGDLSEVDTELFIEGYFQGPFNQQREMWCEDLLDLHEFIEHLEYLLDCVLLIQLQRIHHQGNEVLVLLQYFDRLGCLSYFVYSFDG